MGFVPKGIYPAMLTPLTEDQSIDESALKQLTNHLIDAHVHGLFALGTNGEFHMFNTEDKLKVAEIIIQETAGRVPVMVGSGGNSTEEAIWLSKEMERLGADALSVITPFFIPPTQEEAAVHYKTIAASVSLPVLLYNIPSKTGFHLDPETVAELAKVDNIVGIKDSSGNFENIQQYIEQTKNEDFSVFAGTDSLIFKTLQAGGAGAVAATANMLPDIVTSIYHHWAEGETEKAEAAQMELQPLRDTFRLGTIPAALKKAVELYSIPVGPPKAPVKELTGPALLEVEKMVASYQSK
ncbi:4-hydroxy-tetrahydrodipicolinate synthase [Bacillus licheniformis]|uniref:4-hydroxy-tetrahydrodipicolinate synthase n=1 Tax=Bacillus licheniformis TaxID=1402 RepID=UPI0011A8176F|nr:4-hydroxy-tetrahydrodipicolinate synthase [Bacillus licheniformis]MCZ0106960.1 4-hydroxy-tetrahydrodipicolinate synthase [Bacillus licheniformis]TWJ90456.1 4-hydroxy-tetrahydrodipicolinate synthase [Bacillus licheniformis]TWN74304.1 4-hydroxy-tetrahydrodipicolinate synthase [Bacillus licheniformis]